LSAEPDQLAQSWPGLQGCAKGAGQSPTTTGGAMTTEGATQRHQRRRWHFVGPHQRWIQQRALPTGELALAARSIAAGFPGAAGAAEPCENPLRIRPILVSAISAITRILVLPGFGCPPRFGKS